MKKLLQNERRFEVVFKGNVHAIVIDRDGRIFHGAWEEPIGHIKRHREAAIHNSKWEATDGVLSIRERTAQEAATSLFYKIRRAS